MSIEDSYQTFFKAFLGATKNVDERYFKLKVGYSDTPIYRERAYCYELYHQIRTLLGNDFSYILSGEIDKRGYEAIAVPCGEIKPDFLIHQPGVMSKEGNLVIIEVKPITVKMKDFVPDIDKLNCMTDMDEGYYKAIMLLYGDEKLDSILIAEFKNICSDNLDNITLLHHRNVGEPAVRIDI